MGGRSFLRVFERRVNISFHPQTVYEVLERPVKEGSGYGQLSP
jgi:hypothetical protein